MQWAGLLLKLHSLLNHLHIGDCVLLLNSKHTCLTAGSVCAFLIHYCSAFDKVNHTTKTDCSENQASADSSVLAVLTS